MTEKVRGPQHPHGHLRREGPLTPSDEVAEIIEEHHGLRGDKDAWLWAYSEPELDPTRPEDSELLADTELGRGK